MINKRTKLALFIASLSIIGLIISLAFVASVCLITFPIKQLLFFPQFIIFGILFLLIFPCIMIFISNLYFNKIGEKHWESWFQISLEPDYDYIFTIISIMPSIFLMTEFSIFCYSKDLEDLTAGSIVSILIWFPLYKGNLKKIFGHTAEVDTFFSIAKEKPIKIEEKIDANDFIIRQPKTSLILYIVFTAIFSSIGFIILLEDWRVGVWGLPIILFFPSFIILWYRWKIIVKDNQITSTSYFGKTKSFTFDYITEIKRGIRIARNGDIECIKAYHKKEKLFTVVEICPNFHILASRLEKEGVPIINIGRSMWF